MPFDPDGAGLGGGLFGLPFTEEQARFVVLPAPFDATTSYRDGARHGPEAILAASTQLDLRDPDFGRPWEEGIFMRPPESGSAQTIARLNEEARALAAPIIEKGGELEGDPALIRALARVNALSEAMCAEVEAEARALLRQGRVPIVLGGDHSTPLGALRAYADDARTKGEPLGVLHIDAHADLRVAYEGFTYSHASVMHRALEEIGGGGGLAHLVQVGIRDFGERELIEIERERGPEETKITTHFDRDIQMKIQDGVTLRSICESIIKDLPRRTYISLDIDGLDPKLCPDTGTPVPGGLDWNDLLCLLRTLVGSGREIVGFDLVEVAPSASLPRARWGEDWNANVGARLLYKLIGATAASRRG